MDFGGGETTKSAENEVAEEVKKNANPKIVIFFNFIFQANSVSIFVFFQNTKDAFFGLRKNSIGKVKPSI